MSSIQLKETELVAMRRLYREELDKTLSRLAHIKSILESIDPGGTTIDININSLNGIGKKQDAIITGFEEKPTRRKGAKRGPKGIWADLIIKRMRQLDRPVTYDELTAEVMLLAKIPPEKKESTLQSIRPVIFRLRNRENRLDTFSVGQREKYIALKSWFDAPGVIKPEYANKIELPKKARAKRGSKPSAQRA